jgi:hypothetical protein
MNLKILCVTAFAVSSPTFAGSVVFSTSAASGDTGDGGASFITTGIADFTLSEDSNVKSFTMTMLANFDGVAATSTDVMWAIYSRSGGVVGAFQASGTKNGIGSSNYVVTGSNFNVYDVTVEIDSELILSAGDYYLATQRQDDTNFAFWAFSDSVDNDIGALFNFDGVFAQSGDITGSFEFPTTDYAFSINGNTITVVPLPPAAFAGLGILGCMGAYRRIRK